MGKRERSLIIIGGHEDKENDQLILREAARRVSNDKLVVCTAATEQAQEMFDEYERVFRGLGIKHIRHLSIESRGEGRDEKNIRLLEDAGGVFFTGGDQLMITSRMGDTPCFQLIQRIYDNGGMLAGTSAGAAVMCETMMVAGNGDQSHRLRDTIKMAPGFGFMKGVILDQHFAERGRVGRLLGVVAQNPKNIGIGIDENTAIVVEADRSFYVLGAGAVYVIDCGEVTESNIADEELDTTLSVYDVKLHLLSAGYGFDLRERRPLQLSAKKLEEKIPPMNPRDTDDRQEAE